MKKTVVLLHMLMFLSLALIASAQTALKIGVASYYVQPYIPSACFHFEDKGVLLASVNNGLWQDGNICGQIYVVHCLGARNNGVRLPCNNEENGKPINGVPVRVVDYCQDCNGSTMLLSGEAFAYIAKIEAGSILITYEKST